MTRDEALALATARRCAGAAVKREVRAGRLDVAEAFFDERAAVLQVGILLQSQRGWGVRKATKFLRYLGGERLLARRIGELTERQRGALADAVKMPLQSVSKCL